MLNIFKSKKKADSIFINGNIYKGYGFNDTVEAVAIKDGLIIALGDYDEMEELVNEDTLTVDLEGKYVLPGFINFNNNSVLETFFEQYIHLDESMSLEEIIDSIEGMSYYYDQRDIIFGYGYSENAFNKLKNEDIIKRLDEISQSKPVLLVSSNNMECVYNSVARNIILGTAEEEVVEIITLPYILNLLIPYDFAEIMEKLTNINNNAKEKGFTTLCNVKSPYFFDEVFENALLDLYNEGNLNFKYQGSFYINRQYNLKYIKYMIGKLRTNCSELSNYMEHDILFVDMNKHMKADWLSEVFKYCEEVKISIQIECSKEEELNEVISAFDSSKMSETSNLTVIYNGGEVESFVPFKTIYSQRKSFDKTMDLIRDRTETGAEVIGADEILGVIQEGYVADFAIFDECPLEMKPADFMKMNTSITVINGEIVYNEEKERDDEWYDIFSGTPL